MTFRVNELVDEAGWVSVAIKVMVVVPDLCNPGWRESRRLVPKPLNTRLALPTRLVFEELAVKLTLKMFTADRALSLMTTGASET